ncbi:MAG: IclR family transcriptional regulator [Rhodospirillales bacterium]|nr:IclR family transcriptional regulator [Rhodospirillales bacterium]
MTEAPKVLERYTNILEAVAPFHDGLSLAEIARSTGLPKATAHRLVASLTELGFIAAGRGRNAYRIGPRLLRLLHAHVRPATIDALVRPLLDRLAREFEQTAFLAKLVGSEVHSVLMVAPDTTAQAYVQPGRVMAPNAAASAKAILAFQPPEVVDQALAAPLRKYTANTCVDPGRIRDYYAQVQRDGYAVCLDEMDPGVMTVAVPIRLADVGVPYSIGIVGLQAVLCRHELARLVAALRETAARAAETLQIGIGYGIEQEHGSEQRLNIRALS